MAQEQGIGNACPNGVRKGRKARLGLTALVALLALAFSAGAAQASTVTVGSVLPIEYASQPFGQVKTMFNTAIPERGANLTSPVSGAIVRWRIQGAKGGPFYLRVLHPNGAGAYSSAGTSGGVTPSSTGVQVFSANIPIKAGDQIGIDPTNPTDEIGVAPVPNASFGFIFPPPPDGSLVAPNGTGTGEIELSAEVQPAPTVTGLSVGSGSIVGGTEVTITGTDLNGTSAVEFGDLQASSYTVKSDTEIVAVSPPSAEPGPVDVAVTTNAGASGVNSRGNSFTYQACVVPNLKRNRLGAAKTRLRGHGCRPGTVTKLGEATAKEGLVVIQNPKPGKILPPGAKVNVKLGLPRKKTQQAK